MKKLYIYQFADYLWDQYCAVGFTVWLQQRSNKYDACTTARMFIALATYRQFCKTHKLIDGIDLWQVPEHSYATH